MLDLRQMAAALGGDISGNQISCPGPGHKAKSDRSLSIRLDPNAPDGFLCHSFAQDDPIVCRDYIREKCGLPAFKPNGGNRRHRSSQEIEKLLAAAIEHERKPVGTLFAKYRYVDRDGTLLYQVLKYINPKRFVQRRPDGNGKWIYNLQNQRRVIYRWPQIIESSGTVFVTEGEKDADSVIERLKYPATTVASGKWTPDCVEALRGRDCWILEDNDPAGRAKALDAAVNLYATATSIKIIRLPGLAEGGDISDWLDHGHTAEEFEDVCYHTPLWSPDNAGGDQTAGKENNEPVTISEAQETIAADDPAPSISPTVTKALVATPKFKLIPFNEITVGSTAVYLVKGIIPRTGLVIIWGPPKCGKSFWTFDVFMHLALGWKYRDRRVQQGPVAYLAMEGSEGFKARIEAFRRHHLEAQPNVIPPFFLITAPVNLVKDHQQLISSIRQQIGDQRPVAVVIDTLNRSLVGSESDDRDMAAYIKAADAIGDAFDCVVPIVHHCGIEGTRPRGHTSLTGAAQAQLSVKRDAANNVITEVEWMKDGPEGAVIASRLDVVEVGIDEDGEPITSCVVVPADEILQKGTPQTKTTRLPKAAQIALRALGEAVQELGAVPPASNHIPTGVRTVTIDDWRKYANARGISTGEERAKQQAFKRATDLLIANQHVGIWDEQAWPVT
jgi:hypothetical protein